MNIRGGGTLDRVVVNNWPEVYVRMYVTGEKVKAFAIMVDNDELQTKFIGYNSISSIPASFISNPFHIIIDNVWINTGTSTSDVDMKQSTRLHINDDEYDLWGTWTSTVKPDNTKVELDCEVVENSNSIVTAKCILETAWDESVFNRIPISTPSVASVGSYSVINQALFGTKSFKIEGSTPLTYYESTRYNVTGNGSNLTIGGQLTIMGLPESFVNHWVDMDAEAYMGNTRVLLMPPKSP